jgi:hypothetical protein
MFADFDGTFDSTATLVFHPTNVGKSPARGNDS